MTPSVISAGPDASFRELVHLMTTHDVNRIPIRRWIAATEGVVDVDVRNLQYRADDRKLEPASGFPGAFLR